MASEAVSSSEGVVVSVPLSPTERGVFILPVNHSKGGISFVHKSERLYLSVPVMESCPLYISIAIKEGFPL